MKSVKSFVLNNLKYILFISLLILFNIILIYSLYLKSMINNKYIYIITIIIYLLIFIFYSVFLYKKEHENLEQIYLKIVIPLGLLYLVLFPINTIPDENNHFLRIYEISTGHLVSKVDNNIQGRNFNNKVSFILNSTDYNTELTNLLKYNQKKNTKQFYGFPNTALYSFICYLPQTTGLLIGKILHLPIIIQAFCARLFNFIIFVFLTYLSIKIIPVKKSSVLILLLSPLVIQEAVSLSPDCLTISIITFFISYILNLKEKKNEKVTKKELLILTISSIILSLCKIVYLPICFLLFLLPKTKFRDYKDKNIKLLLIVLAAIITNLVWLKISSNFLPNNSNINSSKQLHGIFGNLIEYMLVLMRTYGIDSERILFESFGISLGRFEVGIIKVYVLILLLLFLYTVLLDNNNLKIKFTNLEKLFMIIIVFMVILLISTSLYLQWTPVGARKIKGIQGRYLIPLYLICPLVFSKYTLKPKINILNKYLYMLLIMINLYALSAIFYHFI